MKNWILRVFRKLFAKKNSSFKSQQEQKIIGNLLDEEHMPFNNPLLDENYKLLMKDFDERKYKSEGGSASSPISR